MYDPENEYTEELNFYYLQEDLLQIVNDEKNITVDVGWYGDLHKNDGKFKIYVIRDLNWENPEQEIESNSSLEVYNKLIEVIHSMKQ